jgi:hypothetical protein
MIARYTIRTADFSGTTGNTINIPISGNFQLADQSDIIKRDFVNKEVENAINPIVDYEKTRLLPVNNQNDLLNVVKYALHFNSGDYYDNIGFVQDDIKFQRNNFKRSFLRLKFFDSNQPTTQNLLFTMSMYPRLTSSDIGSNGQYKNINTIPVSFTLSNPVTNPGGYSEGYHLYYFKGEILPTVPKVLYMEAEFNNAKTGKTTKMMTTSTPQDITTITSKLYTKYILKRISTGYIYEMDSSFSTNVSYSITNVTINLYERTVI